jgi:ribosomal protein L37AE/L43A
VGFALVFGAVIGIAIGIVKIKSEWKEGKTGKCRFCGAKMAGRYTIEMPVCQRCGRTQPWVQRQAEQAQESAPVPQPSIAPVSATGSVRRCPSCRQPLTVRAGDLVHAYSQEVSCREHARVMGLPAPLDG